MKDRAELNQRLLEAIAQPLPGCQGKNCDDCPEDGVGPCFCKLQRDAVKTAIKDAGYVLVPGEIFNELISCADSTLTMIDEKRKAGDITHWESFSLTDFAEAIEAARAASPLREGE